MDNILMEAGNDIITHLAEDLEIARLCGDNDENHAKTHFIQHKVSETIISLEHKDEYFPIAEFLVEINARGIQIPQNTTKPNIISIVFPEIKFEIYRHDYIGNGYLRFEVNGERSIEHKISTSPAELANTIAQMPKQIEVWLADEYPQMKAEALKQIKQLKINQISAKAMLEGLLGKLGVEYQIEHQEHKSEVSIMLSGERELHISVTYNDFISEIGKIPEMVRNAKIFSENYPNAKIV